MIKKFCLLLMLTIVSLLSGICVYAQAKAEPADLMRSEAKIYVVMAVCLTILTGLLFYLFRIERKVNRLEKESKANL